MKKYFTIGYSYIVFGLFFAFFLNSCKDNQVENGEVYDPNAVNFVVSDIIEDNDNDIKAIASLSSKSEEKSNIDYFDGFAIEWDLDSYNTSILKEKLSHDINLKSNLVKTAATRKMELGKKYRLLIYEVDLNNKEVFVQSKDVTVSKEPFRTIVPNPDGTYKWYAYSYDDTNSVPEPTDLQNPTMPTRNNAPFLYAYGGFTLDSKKTNIPKQSITFKHKVSKIELNVNGEGVSAVSFNKLNISLSNFNVTTHSINLKTGVKVAQLSSASFNKSLTFNTLLSKLSKSNTAIYTSLDNFTVKVTINDLVINTSNGTKTLVTSTAPVTRTFNILSNTNFIKVINIKLTPSGIIFGDLEWAEGNLYYDGSAHKIGTPRTYRGEEACNYYFEWDAIYPRSYNLSVYGDPCSRVVPVNTWRTPNAADYNNLLSYGFTMYPDAGIKFYSTVSKRDLWFHEGGTSTHSDPCKIGNLTDGQFWTSDEKSNSEGYALEIDGDNYSINKVVHRNINQGRLVRCVRKVK